MWVISEKNQVLGCVAIGDQKAVAPRICLKLKKRGNPMMGCLKRGC
jgi:hypothetical protein